MSWSQHCEGGEQFGENEDMNVEGGVIVSYVGGYGTVVRATM